MSSSWRRSRFTVAVLAVAGLAACRDDLGPTSPGAVRAAQESAAAGMSHGRGRGLEEEGPLGRFAANNPAFGGWFFDGQGDLNVWVVDPEGRGASTRAAAAQAMAGVPRDATEKQSYQVRVLPAQYSFVQLSDWRDSLSTRFEAYRGLKWTDVDDVRNRVSASVDSRRTRALLRRDAARMGIPAGAVNVMSEPIQCTPEMLDCNADPCMSDPYAPGCDDPCSTDPYAPGCEDPCSIDPNSPECVDDPCVANPSDPACGTGETAPDTAMYQIVAPPVAGTLSGRFDQLQGGIQIAYEDIDRSVAPTCTIGFVANSRNYGSVIVTAAHCSNDLGSTDGTVYGQPTNVNNAWESDWFGQEVYDPPLLNKYTWNCPLGCRNSDANFVSTSMSGPNFWFGRGAALGKIARPIGPKTSINDTTTRINTSAPQLTISGETRVWAVGSAVHKIGRTTGWTRGTLTYYCQKKRGYYCQDGANYVFRVGDSGSPVFRLNTSGTVALVGIHHSRIGYTNYNESIYSPLIRIRKDLGAFQTYPGGPF